MLKVEQLPRVEQTLTPQQIQYLKLLQLSTLQLEQHIKQELEENPMLEEVRSESDEALEATEESVPEEELSAPSGLVLDSPRTSIPPEDTEWVPSDLPADGGDELSSIQRDDSLDDYFNQLWKESDSYSTEHDSDEEDGEPFIQRIRDVPTLEEELLDQLGFLDLQESERMLAEQIIGSLDHDGYLRRPLAEVLAETNDRIAELLYERSRRGEPTGTLGLLSLDQAERVLKRMQVELDPPGCGSRSLQECLIAQLRALPERNAHEQLALRILTEAFDDLANKHYADLAAKLGTTEEALRKAVEVIRRLNPTPGSSREAFADPLLTIIPDFIVERDEETNQLVISLNEGSLPQVRLSRAYQQFRRKGQRTLNRETRQWLHRKYEDAKALLAALKQRKTTMLKVMTAIVQLQQRFFEEGPSGLRPLIYKDVADATGLDISTVCRVVNGKYVQTDYGIFELRYFFSEALTTDEGEEVSTRIVKEAIRQIIAQEPKHHPYSDEKISKELKKLGYNVARRTVAKYREQMKIPIARLRREL
ncbi:MAG: RNA polymerase factor sigma-54 [Bacteroidota bacterium]|nr:RNA polymerase factor sigma-54 [Candidatus Kapabacteria bacterium]MCS7302917.1 RNA polymerase factor sigma-54 [Candidatus Kapabacteria bacterium]MCX7937422.1 RNA polymerase factor sigma-54 [Chlorobiota bacterium]MDW8075782.1 RNA polymerase factor sigma-54 [Bacteroidota bacterium]MDW8272461.1 RNA polymerase factor sigma-54 [Bacteroidota bacterium]